MAVTIATLRARYPGVFDSVDDTALTMAVDEAIAQVNRSAYDTDALADIATLYLAAHFGMSVKSSIAGIKSATVGAVQVQFSDAAGDLSSTTYGVQYEEFLKRQIIPFVVAGGSL